MRRWRLWRGWRAVMVSALLSVLAPHRAQAQAGILRGTVTDTTGRPLSNVEVLSVNAKRSTRTDAGGRFTLAKLPFGQQLILARLPGYQPADQAVNMLDAQVPELSFTLRRVIVALDTVRIVSHDGCAAYDFAGFDCRRRAGIGQFRGESELTALRPIYWASKSVYNSSKITFSYRNLSDFTSSFYSVSFWYCFPFFYEFCFAFFPPTHNANVYVIYMLMELLCFLS